TAARRWWKRRRKRAPGSWRRSRTRNQISETARWNSATTRSAIPRLPLTQRRIDDRGLDRIRDVPAQRLMPEVATRRVHTIREQHDEQAALRIDPDARAGESGMAECARREEVSCAR